MSRLGHLVAVVAVAATATLAGGCAASTPLCDTAATLLARGQVASAAELYARAAQAGEGGCADDGVTAAGEAFGRAYGEVAAGSAAETSGDAGAAIGHYEAAQRIDGDNQAALAGLTRMNRTPVRVQTPVTVVPGPGSSAASGPGWPTIAALVLLAVVAVAGVVVALRMRSRLGSAEDEVRRLDASVADAAGERALTAGAVTELSDRTAAVEGETRTRHDRLGALRADVDTLRRQETSTAVGDLRTRLLDTRAELTDVTDATHDRIDRRFLELIRLLVTLRDNGTEPTDDDRPVVLHWADTDVVDTLSLLVTAVSAANELVVHEFRLDVEGDGVRVDIDDAALPALRGLAASPEHDAAADTLRDALGVAAIERRGRVAAALPAVEPRLLTAPERAVRRALGAAALVVTQDPECGRRVVVSCHRRDAASLFLDAPELVELLGALVSCDDRDAAREDLEVALQGVVEDRLVEHLLSGVGRSSI